MDALTDISNRVLKKTDIQPDQKFGSVLAIIMIIGIIVNVVRVMQECDKEEKQLFCNDADYSVFFRNKIKDMCQRKSFIHIMRIKKILRQHLSRNDYHQYKEELTNAIIETGSELSITDTYTLLEQAND